MRTIEAVADREQLRARIIALEQLLEAHEETVLKQTARLEKALKDNQRQSELLRSILDAEPECVQRVAADGTLLQMNVAGLRMIEADSFEQVAGRSVYPLIASEFLEQFRRMHAAVLDGAPRQLQFQIVGLKGTRRWLESNGVCLRNPGDNRVEHLAVARDITRRKQAEEALHKSEEHFRALIEHSLDIITVLEPDGTIRYESPSLRRVLGWNPAELIGQNAFTFIFPEDLPFVKERFALVLQHPGLLQSVEFRFQHKNDSWRILESIGKLIQDAQGKPCVVINSRDITERKLAEAGLRESNERFTGAFDHAAIGMGIVTTEGRWIAVNSALCKIVGYSEQELRATTFQAITHPDDLDRDLAYVRQMLAGEIQTYQMEKRYIHKQGAVVWILLNVSLVRDAQGAPMYFVAQIQDITERKQAEQAQTWLASIVESSNDAIFSRDLDGTILTWNLGAEIMFGYTAEEMIGQPITALVPPDRLGEESHFLDRIREGHRIDYFETVRQRKDGHSVHVSVSLSPISDRKGHLVAISQITRNITERMDVQRALHQAFEEREQLSLDLHDNIIQIVYATGLALEDCVYRLSDRAGPSAQILGQAIDNLNCVIQDLRGFIHGDQRELIEPLQFESELDRLAQTMSLRNILAWDLRVAPSAIARLTALEATQLLFIAREAISNTMQHSQGRTVTIALVTTAEGVLLTVEDDGIGFETIIKPGHGLRNMATRAHKLGAQYKIISSPGQGTKILVQLLKENAYGIE